MPSTPNQLRAICPACFNEQAIRANGTMVQHGYTRPQGWNANVGDCYGTGRPHFGTPEGRAVTAEVIKMCHTSAAVQKDLARRMRAGELPVIRRDKPVEKPTAQERENAAVWHDHQATSATSEAKRIQTRYYDPWKPRKPRPVVVVKRPPVVHLNHNSRKACAGPFNSNPYGGDMTTDEDKVTCTRCLTHIKYVNVERAWAAAKAKQ